MARFRSRLLLFAVVIAAPAIIIEMCIFAFNIYVDPLWTFPFAARPFAYCVRNERVNKVNLLEHSFHKWNGVIIGNSRTAFIDPAFFKNADVFNLAVNGMRISEYIDYLKMFVRHVGEPEVVYVAFDFIADSGGADNAANSEASRGAAEIESETSRPLYPEETALDWTTASYSFEVLSVCNSAEYERPIYRYGGAEQVRRQTYDIQHDQMIADQAEGFVQSVMLDATYRPDILLRQQIGALKRLVPHSKIVAFVPPITSRLFLAEMAAGRMDDYLKWLNILVSEFGSVRFFAGLNSFTEDIRNFYDGHHVYSDLTRQEVDILEGRTPPHPDGFGQVIDSEGLPPLEQSLRDDVCNKVEPRPETPDHVRGCLRVTPRIKPEKEVYSIDPASNNWRAALDTTKITRDGTHLLLKAAPGISEYQILSPVVSVSKGATYEIDADIHATRGRMSLGVLDFEANRWVALWPIDVEQTWAFKAPSSKIQIILALNNQSPIPTEAIVNKIRLLAY